MPAKKKAKAKATKPRAAKPAAAPKALNDGAFVSKMFESAEASIGRVADPTRRSDLSKRFKALRAKFRKLPKSKVTRDRAERYAEEVSKLEREAVMPKAADGG